MRRMTNQEVADRIGLTHTAVSRIRSGQRRASVAVIRRIVSEFGADADRLLEAAEAQDPTQWIKYLDELLVTNAPDHSSSVPA
jgi:transcriptional regulator with XRE-family HTH domain